jgi:predicted pyridoxine 5'-phosphate oxidase superfamily flavin-nucleotide-binding protein
MAHDPRALPDGVSAFLAERHLATLTTLRPDGTPHVVAVGFTWDPEAGLVRVITNGTVAQGRARAGPAHRGRWWRRSTGAAGCRWRASRR